MSSSSCISAAISIVPSAIVGGSAGGSSTPIETSRSILSGTISGSGGGDGGEPAGGGLREDPEVEAVDLEKLEVEAVPVAEPEPEPVPAPGREEPEEEDEARDKVSTSGRLIRGGEWRRSMGLEGVGLGLDVEGEIKAELDGVLKMGANLAEVLTLDLALAGEALKDLVRRVLGEVEGVSRDLDFDREGMRGLELEIRL
jgi:hypothetical protein